MNNRLTDSELKLYASKVGLGEHSIECQVTLPFFWACKNEKLEDLFKCRSSKGICSCSADYIRKELVLIRRDIEAKAKRKARYDAKKALK